jgi:hypothetical protein
LQEGGVTLMIFVMDSSTYRSGFVQLYLLGRYDPELYKEIINIYPLIRVFQLIR